MKKVQEVEFRIFFNRYSKTNNKYLKSYDSKQISKHIIYLDANNLYGYAISKFLQTSGFKWIDPKTSDLDKYTSNSSKGCVLKVDLEYSKELRELHNDIPLASDKDKYDGLGLKLKKYIIYENSINHNG